jgi:hypothetical protein
MASPPLHERTPTPKITANSQPATPNCQLATSNSRDGGSWNWDWGLGVDRAFCSLELLARRGA